jgi:bifunctional polynucleotide phosphatase/kinase
MRVWGRGPVWEWESTHDVFVPYPPETSDEIERRFSRDELTASIILPISAHESADFLIHFGHMWQENRETKQHRRIRRSVMDLLELPKPALSAGVPTQKRAREGVDGNISARSSPPSLEQWKMVDSVMVLHRVPTAGTIKVAGFDMDDTLVYPKSGAVFAKSKSDWQWVSPQVVPKLRELHTEGYTIVVFSNQSGIFGKKCWNECKATECKAKIIDFLCELKVSGSAYVATAEDNYRKPCTGMWDLFIKNCLPAQIDVASSMYIGDAAGRKIMTLAGRKKDFSCSDRKFAYNANLKFKTPEEFFEGKPPAPFDWGGLGPDDLRSIGRKYQRETYHSATQEMVVFVGFPGCGKSTFFARKLAPHGYERINRDSMRTVERCMSNAVALLSQGKSVAIDNTNPSIEDRARFIKLARERKVPVRAFVMQHTEALANHMNILRSRLGIVPRVSSVAYNIFKSRYQPVDTIEGFDEIVNVEPVADFEGLPPDASRLFYQLS